MSRRTTRSASNLDPISEPLSLTTESGFDDSDEELSDDPQNAIVYLSSESSGEGEEEEGNDGEKDDVDADDEEEEQEQSENDEEKEEEEEIEFLRKKTRKGSNTSNKGISKEVERSSIRRTSIRSSGVKQNSKKEEVRSGKASKGKNSIRQTSLKRQTQDYSDSEEEFLNAIENEDYESIAGSKLPNESALTSRQKALLRKGSNPPSESTSDIVEPISEKLSIRRTQSNMRRKDQSQQRAEEEKIATIQRLLQKQTSKRPRRVEESSMDILPSQKTKFPCIHYVQRMDGSTLSFPTSHVIKATNMNPRSLIATEKCIVDNCYNQRRYLHSTAKVPICSLNCWRIVSVRSQESTTNIK